MTSSEDTQWPGDGLQSLEIDAADRRARLHQGADAEQPRRALEPVPRRLDRLARPGGLRRAALRPPGRQRATVRVAGHPAFPGLAPAVRFDGYDAPFDWSNLSPRLGLAYALDAVRRTVARLSFSRYTGRPEPFRGRLREPRRERARSPTTFGTTWTETAWRSRPRWSRLRRSPPAPRSAAGEGLGGLPVAIDEELRAPRTTEFIAGIRSRVSARSDARRSRTSISASPTCFGSRGPAASAPNTWSSARSRACCPDGAPYEVPYFAPLADAGRVLSNRPGYHQHYNGWQLQARRGFADGWMLRVRAAYDSHREVLETRRTATATRLRSTRTRWRRRADRARGPPAATPARRS